MKFTSSILVLASCLALIQAAPILPNESESSTLERRYEDVKTQCFFYCGGGSGGILAGLFGSSNGGNSNTGGASGPSVYPNPGSLDEDEDNGDLADEYTK